MSRIIVVTGAGSGIGKATADVLKAQGNTVIGLDLRGSDIDVDVTDREGSLAQAAKEIEEKYGHVDGVVANAGVFTGGPLDLKVNYFGAIDTVEVFKPLLEKSDAPRVAVMSSAASLQPADLALVKAMLAFDKDTVTALAEQHKENGTGFMNYNSSKRAIATWVRTVAPSEEYAGKGIAVNAVGPGIVQTPLVEEQLKTEEGRKMILGSMPAPLNGVIAPETIGNTIAFLVSKENVSMCGQILYIDGGYDSLPLGRGADIWHDTKDLEDIN